MKKNSYKIFKVVLVLFGALFIFSCSEMSKQKVLIIGSNPQVQETLAAILENSGLFKSNQLVLTEESASLPNFSKFQLIVFSDKPKEWPDEGDQDLLEYLKSGGGLVLHHSTQNAFSEWQLFSEITGLSGWNPAEEQSKLIFENDPRERVKMPLKGAMQTDAHEYIIHISDPDHPITKGMPEQWMHVEDELFNYLVGPGNNLNLLATAYSDTAYKGSAKFEPVIFTNSFEQGRIFHTTLGREIAGNKSSNLQCAGFIFSFQRGAEWAATGQVSLSMPVDFPNSASTMTWPNYRPYTLDELFAGAANFSFGKSRKYLSDISERVRNANRNEEDLTKFEKKMIEFLNSEASSESKNYILQELSWMGTDACIPSLENLLENEATSTMANFALTRLKAN